MSRSLGPALPPGLLALLSQADLAPLLGRALPLLTLGADGTLHPMLCSYLELLAVDAGTLRVVVGAGSRTARNLEERGVATLLLIEPERVVYIKGRATGAPLRRGALARFTLAVEEVLEDRPEEAEGPVSIVSGIRYEPVASLEAPWARAVLAALREG